MSIWSIVNQKGRKMKFDIVEKYIKWYRRVRVGRHAQGQPVIMVTVAPTASVDSSEICRMPRSVGRPPLSLSVVTLPISLSLFFYLSLLISFSFPLFLSPPPPPPPPPSFSTHHPSIVIIAVAVVIRVVQVLVACWRWSTTRLFSSEAFS